MIFRNFVLFVTVLVFVGCGGSTSDNSTEASEEIEQGSVSVPSSPTDVTVSGKVTYDFVPFNSGLSGGLNYNNITEKPVRGATVDIVNSSGSILGTTSTDENGEYSVMITGTSVKVRVSAKLYQAASSGKPSWDFKVKDNTNSDALYVMEGSLAGLGDGSTQTRNLHADSGWGTTSYTSERVAGPFAILDVAYEAIQKVTEAESDAVFGSLDIFWSINNISASGDKTLGQISTSHFDGTSLYILGKDGSDTDEYDVPVVGHEWGHYYESAFSRSDSIGGSHSGGDMLDIRVAFGEGFGTAMGCIIIDSPIYVDSLGTAQSQSFGTDLETTTPSSDNPGWFNESSIYRMLYDFYDSNDDDADTLSLGFKPIHDILTDSQQNTEAFTSIFTFITALKADYPNDTDAIDAITTNESMAPITDIYGTGRTNRTVNANPLYASLSVGSSVNFTTDYSATSTAANNRLGAYNFVKFTIPSSGMYTIGISQLGGSGTPDPDIYLYKGSSSDPIATAVSSGTTDSITASLSAGTYRMAVIIYNQNSNNTFTVTLNQ